MLAKAAIGQALSWLLEEMDMSMAFLESNLAICAKSIVLKGHVLWASNLTPGICPEEIDTCREVRT